MASNTERLGLLKKDPILDGADTFNIKTMLNDNWNRIDEIVALIDPVTGKLLPGQENPVDVSDIQTKLDNIETSVGDLTSLETSEKANLVAAINEIRRALATHLADGATGAHNISNITGLQSVLDGKQPSLPIENRRKITFGTTAPTGGVNGDIYFQYE